MMLIKPDLAQNRAISLKKGGANGLRRRTDRGWGHGDGRLLTGKLSYADPFWEVIELSTADGTKSFAVDSVAGSKLSALKEGSPVRLEMDEDNMVINIHRATKRRCGDSLPKTTQDGVS
jgi:hypothetical protein